MFIHYFSAVGINAGNVNTMNSRKPNNNIDQLTRIYVKWGQNSLLFTLACLVWFAWRVGTKPARLRYPCSQFALTQIVLFFSLNIISFLCLFNKCKSYVHQREYLKIARLAIVIIVLVTSVILYRNITENQLRIAGSGTIPSSSSTAGPWSLTAKPEIVNQYTEFPSTISTNNAVVSFGHNPSMNYGGTTPYNLEVNPAYSFVWETVEKLRLGSPANPLDDIINVGDTVLIKPNWVDFSPATFTRPEVVRPLIDMAIAAGATTIYIGDGGGNLAVTDNVINNAGYAQMVSDLTLNHPGITIQTVNLNSLQYGWHWIKLGNNSSFAGSGYTNYDLATPGGTTLYKQKYYSTPDPQGLNPNGETLGWYAVNDKILSADVIINVPKMKTHQCMIATLSVKDLVGCALGCTYDETVSDCGPRIAHHKTSGQDWYFNNDVFWRAILDINKIILYGAQNGTLQPAPQRKCLNVIDGIEAMEESQDPSSGGTSYDRNVILASVDPVAIDAVGCRVMGYDYRVIPSISNADSDSVHPVGTNDPHNILVIGDAIDENIDHVFAFNDAWAASAGSLAITDFTPPTINSTNREGNKLIANISGGLTACVLYQIEGSQHAVIMSKNGDTYSVTVPVNASEYQILAQDDYFNTAAVTIVGFPSVITITSPATAGTSVDDNFTVQPVIQVRDSAGNPVGGTTVSASRGNGTGTLRGTLTAVSDTAGLAAFTDLGYNKSGEAFTIRFAAGGLSVNSASLGPLSTGAAAQIRVETAANGSGSVVRASKLTIGRSLTVYGVSRDQFGNYTGNPGNTAWSLISKAGNVVDSDLITAVGSSAIMKGNKAGSGIIHAYIDGLTSVDSGIITVAKVVSSGGGGGGGGTSTMRVSLNGLVSAAPVQVNSQGILQGAVQLKTSDGKVTLDLTYGARLLTANNNLLSSLTAENLDSPPAPVSGQTIIAAYNFGPDGAKFDPALTLTMSYDSYKLPENISEEGLYIAYYDGTQWQSLNSTIDTKGKVANAKISLFRSYALMGKVTLPSPTPVTAIVAANPIPTQPSPTTHTPVEAIPSPSPSIQSIPVQPALTETPSPAGVTVLSIQTDVNTSSAVSPSQSKPKESNNLLWWLLLMGLVVAGIIVVVVFTKSRDKSKKL
jgi:uncharacterized protein (DUF362 family)